MRKTTNVDVSAFNSDMLHRKWRRLYAALAFAGKLPELSDVPMQDETFSSFLTRLTDKLDGVSANALVLDVMKVRSFYARGRATDLLLFRQHVTSSRRRNSSWTTSWF